MLLGRRPVQNADPAFVGGANASSLVRARENYIRFGVCDPAFRRHTRPPNIDEVPTPPSIRGLEPNMRDATLRGIKTVMLGVVQGILSRRISIFDGCTAVSVLTLAFVTESELEPYLVFEGVASEVQDLPNAHTRHLCSPEALNVEDEKAADYERRVGAAVKAACKHLEDHLRRELLY